MMFCQYPSRSTCATVLFFSLQIRRTADALCDGFGDGFGTAGTTVAAICALHERRKEVLTVHTHGCGVERSGARPWERVFLKTNKSRRRRDFFFLNQHPVVALFKILILNEICFHSKLNKIYSPSICLKRWVGGLAKIGQKTCSDKGWYIAIVHSLTNLNF